ncbi:hypothetical protein AGMMS49991_08090 [Spirochaetia bacterium]|nr:hypothetical protein AGMMS49991_08090 [Spirochaetia bacterium]
MKKLLFIVPVFLMFAGCWIEPIEHLYRVSYGSERPYEGTLPVDRNEYQTGDTATILGPGDLTRGEDYEFEGWHSRLGVRLYQPGEKITFTDSNFSFTASWKYIGEDYKYDVTEAGTEVTITRYFGNLEYPYKLTIPDFLGENNLPVTLIADGALRGAGIWELILPSHLKSIGFEAFSNYGLQSVVIPDSVTVIEDSAFQKNNLLALTLGSGIEAIGDLAFQNNNLSTLDLGTNLKTIGAYAFKDNALTRIVIPSTVTSIGNGAFQGNSITSIKIGDGVEIGNLRSMGIYGESFQSFYNNRGKKAGFYLYAEGTWEAYIPDITP